MSRRFFSTSLCIALVLIAPRLKGQSGGRHTYKFLDAVNSARVASLGGNNISLREDDLNMSYQNPALLLPGSSSQALFNYVSYFADIHYGYAAMAYHHEPLGTFSAGLHYIDYGNFRRADEKGNITGQFTAGEYALNLIWSRPLDSAFTIGVNLKPVYSRMESYTSIGLVADVGLTWHNPDHLLTAAVVLKNLGSQITPYHPGNYEPVPTDLQIGVSKRLEHAPFRFSLTAQNLFLWDILYDSPDDQNNLLAEEQNTETPFLEKALDNTMRHLIIGVEIIPFDNVFISTGFNYLRRQELSLEQTPGMVGFSIGFGLKLYKFYFYYGRATYHLAGSSNHFSISTNLSEFYSIIAKDN